jgi:hypothetical protein
MHGLARCGGGRFGTVRNGSPLSIGSVGGGRCGLCRFGFSGSGRGFRFGFEPRFGLDPRSHRHSLAVTQQVSSARPDDAS